MDQRELWRAKGEKILHHRLLLSLSQFQLALRAGVSSRSVMKAERGGLLFPSTLTRLAVALNVPVEELVVRDERLHRLSGIVRRNVETVRRTYETYNTLWLAGDLQFLRQEFPRDFDRHVIWSAASDVPALFNGMFEGLDGVRQFLDVAFETVERTEEMRVEEIHPISDHHVAVQYLDRVFYRPLGEFVVGSGIHLFTFDEGKIVQLHQSARILKRHHHSHGG